MSILGKAETRDFADGRWNPPLLKVDVVIGPDQLLNDCVVEGSVPGKSLNCVPLRASLVNSGLK